MLVCLLGSRIGAQQELTLSRVQLGALGVSGEVNWVCMAGAGPEL